MDRLAQPEAYVCRFSLQKDPAILHYHTFGLLVGYTNSCEAMEEILKQFLGEC